MPRAPKGEKRPADAIGNAIMIAKIATGKIEDTTRRRSQAQGLSTALCTETYKGYSQAR